MDYLFYGAGILAFLLLAVRVQQLALILSFRLRTPRARLAGIDEIPADILLALEPAANELQRLGFKLSHYMFTSDMNAGVTSPIFSSVYYHPEFACYADLGTCFTPSETFPCRVNFLTRYEGGVLFMTFNQEAFSVVAGCPTLIVQDAFALTFTEQFKIHGRGTLLHEERHDDARLLPKLAPEAFVAALDANFRHYTAYLSERNWLAVEGDHFRFKISAAARLVRQVSRGGKKVAELQKLALQDPDANALAINDKDLETLEVDAYERHEQVRNNSRLKTGPKAAILVGTILLFGAAFGISWSLDTLLILTGVLLFHELGHIAAMRLFGYRDLQILFIPFLGAAALGKHSNPRVYQSAIVSLMGPLPGLLLGTALLWQLDRFESDWPGQLAVILLVVNYLNLLPLMPLDGGQLLNSVLFNRHPRLQFAFFVISVLLLSGWALLDAGPLLFVLALLMVFQIPSQYRHMRLSLSVLRDGAKGEAPLPRVFRTLSKGGTAKLPFIAKYPLARALLERISQAVPRKWEIAACLSLYLAVLVLPLSLIAYQGFMPYTVQTDWETEIAATSELPERLEKYVEAGEDYWMAGDINTGLEFLERGRQSAEANDYFGQEYAQLLQTMTTLYSADGRDAGPLYMQLIELRIRQEGENAAVTAAAHHDYAQHLLYSDGVLSTAGDHIARAMQIQATRPDQSAFYASLLLDASIAEQQGDLLRAETSLRKAAELVLDEEWAGDRQVRYLLADLYVRTERLQDARQQFQVMLDKPAADIYLQAELLNRAGWVELFSGSSANARALFDRAHDLGRQDDLADDEFAEYLFLTDGSSYNHRLLCAVSYWLDGESKRAEAVLLQDTDSIRDQYELHLQDLKTLLLNLHEHNIQGGVDSKAYELTLAMLEALRPSRSG